MRIGFLTPLDLDRLGWAARNRFGSIEWTGFDRSLCGPNHSNWKGPAEQFAAEAATMKIRISAIAALYANPLDPRQTEGARACFLRAIDVAHHLGIRTVAGFSGAVVELDNSHAGHPIYKPFENYLPQFRSFWEPIARAAQDRGVRLAFEHCATGPYGLPIMNYNFMAKPSMWERVFNEIPCDNIGLEWDPSHLICQFMDPIVNLRKFGHRVFHVHAKDAYVNRQLLEEYGICHPGVVEHRMPGFGQANWSEIVHALLRAGYDSDLNIEGRHDPVYRNHNNGGSDETSLIHRDLEDAGLIAARKCLEIFVEGTEDSL